MSDDDECPHGLGERAWCTICNGRAQRERALAREIVNRFAAKYAVPINCGHTPEVGDPIVRLADGRLVCGDCAP